MTGGVSQSPSPSPSASALNLTRTERHDSAPPRLQSGVSGHASGSSSLSGSQVSLRTLPSSAGVASQQAAHLDKMEQRSFGGAVKHMFGALVDCIRTGLSLSRLWDNEATFPTSSLADARADRQDLRDTLGAVDRSRPSVLDKIVDVKGHQGTSVSDLINDSRVNQLGSDKRLSRDEMNTYIRMGEQIVSAIKNSPDGTAPLTVTVNGETRTVPSNLDSSGRRAEVVPEPRNPADRPSQASPS